MKPLDCLLLAVLVPALAVICFTAIILLALGWVASGCPRGREP